MNCQRLLFGFWWIYYFGLCHSYRILGYFPVPGKSQHHIFESILLGLAKKGHQVVYLTPIPPGEVHPNLEVRLIQNFKEEYNAAAINTGLTEDESFSRTYSYYKMFESFAPKLYGQPESQKLIHGSESYDAVLMESTIFQGPVATLIHKFGCVGIEVSTLGDVPWLNEVSGLPNNPAYQIGYHSKASVPKTLVERLRNAYETWSIVLASYVGLPILQSVADKYFNYTGWETRPPLLQLISNKSLILINQGIPLNNPTPLAPHVKEILGVNLRPRKPLPKDLQKYMDESKNGVIYFSLGSNANTFEFMETDPGRAFLDVFRERPENVILKWESDKVPDMPPNVLTSKWIPQQDVLAHKNCKLFITHAGFLSITEAIYHGVAIVALPLFFDQPKNAIHADQESYGLYLDQKNVTLESVKWAINEVLDNPRYRKEVRKRQSMVKDRRQTPLEDAVYWIEYAIKYPNAMTPRSAFLSALELHLIDIKLVLIVFLFIICIIVKHAISILLNILKSNKQKTD